MNYALKEPTYIIPPGREHLPSTKAAFSLDRVNQLPLEKVERILRSQVVPVICKGTLISDSFAQAHNSYLLHLDHR